jgi:biopolymer transport protein ExbB
MLRSYADSLGTAGPIILILLLLSLLSLGLIVAKTMQLWSCRSGKELRERALEQWREGEHAMAIATLNAGTSPADRVAAFAAQGLVEGISRQDLEGELTRRGNEELDEMNRHIRLLELVAMISPLLGLLGTVLGMIQSFQELELAQGAANASLLAGGIWQALLTTAAGLVVAIPAAIGATLLSARIEGAGQMIESAAGRILMAKSG